MSAAVRGDTPPPGLLEAFWAYDRALLADDTAVLDALFAPGPDTLRGDGQRLLVGHTAIAEFRASRAVVPTRRVVEVHLRRTGPDAVLALARTDDAGRPGLQTQLWELRDGSWLVTAAHVSLPPSRVAFDTTVWRVVGDPLVPATGSGPLDGHTVAVKDLFAVAGQPIGAGNPSWLAEQRPQPAHAPAVAALLAAGAAVRGIARTDEFAYSLAGTNAHYGTPPNPAAPDRISGGSSSGSAGAVALGQASIGLGTDTAGSIRIPASYQGLVGLRTTHGAIDTSGVHPLAPTFDTVGWLTRDLATCAAVAETLLPTVSSAPTTPEPVTTLLRVPTVDALVAPAVRAGLDGLVPQDGALDLPAERLEEWFTAFRTLQAWEAWQANGAWLAAHPDAVGADVRARFALAEQTDDAAAARAREVVAAARAELRTALTPGTVLALASAPDAALPRTADAAAIDRHRGGALRMTCLAGLAGAPALSLPLLHAADGLPVGLCLVGAPGTDRALVAAAAALFPGKDRP